MNRRPGPIPAISAPRWPTSERARASFHGFRSPRRERRAKVGKARGALPHHQEFAMDRIEPAQETRWRLDSPGKPDWAHEVRPGENKYFMISVDSHLMPNMREFTARLDRKWHDQMPR